MGQSSGEVIALTAVFTFLELLFTGLRLAARLKRRVGLGADDYLIFVAAILFVPLIAVPIFVQCIDYGMGSHTQTTPDGEPVPPSFLFQVMERIIESCHVIPLGLTKLGVLFFYRRIFAGKVFNIITIATIVLAAVWATSYFFALLFLCYPIAPFLKGQVGPGEHCLDPVQIYYSLSISDVIVDCIILAIPIPFVWRIQMPTRLKIAVSGAFLLGLLTIAASVARMVTFVHEANFPPEKTADYLYYTAPTSYWTLIEASLAIVSACLPTLRPVFQGFSPESVLRSFRSALSIGSTTPRHSDDQLPKHMRVDRSSDRSGSRGREDVELGTVTKAHGADKDGVDGTWEPSTDGINVHKTMSTTISRT